MISMSLAWDKEKIWVPYRIQTYDLPNAGQGFYPRDLRTLFTILLLVLYLIDDSFTEYAVHRWAALNHILRYNFAAFFGRARYSLASHLPYLVKKK